MTSALYKRASETIRAIDPDNAIYSAIADWVADSFQHESSYTLADIIRHLETTDCSACHAPHGLIYNVDIAQKAAAWWNDIDAAAADYLEATGESPAPRNGEPLTIGFLVWFAVEWFAHNAAQALSMNAEG